MSQPSTSFDFSELSVLAFNFESCPYSVPNSRKILSQPPILRTLRIVNKLLGSDQALLELYGGLARKFYPKLSDEEIVACIKDCMKMPLSVVVQTFLATEGGFVTCILDEETTSYLSRTA
jgi:hypothetical protein